MGHTVHFTIPKRQLMREDVGFSVQLNGETLGTLHVSQGAVDWLPAGCTYGHRLTWSQVAKLFEDSGKRCTV